MTGPTAVSGLSAGPTRRARAASTSLDLQRGVVDAVEDDHPRARRAFLTCIAERGLAETPATASSRSASSSMMMAFFPPSRRSPV